MERRNIDVGNLLISFPFDQRNIGTAPLPNPPKYLVSRLPAPKTVRRTHRQQKDKREGGREGNRVSYIGKLPLADDILIDNSRSDFRKPYRSRLHITLWVSISETTITRRMKPQLTSPKTAVSSARRKTLRPGETCALPGSKQCV